MSFKDASDTFFLAAAGSLLGKCFLEWLTKERNEFYNHRASGNQDLFPAPAIKKWKIILSEYQFGVRHYTWGFTYIESVKMIHWASCMSHMVYKILGMWW